MMAKMADRMFRLGGEGRSANYLAKAKNRLETGHCRKADAAIVLAAGALRARCARRGADRWEEGLQKPNNLVEPNILPPP
jgi:hypothetical protein